MSMSRKDFELLARTIKDIRYDVQASNREEVRDAIANVAAKRIASALKGHSATFDAARFLKACGVPE